jgi:nitrile hydratase subunit beta
MNGVHDMGGMHGMGPINADRDIPDGPVFHAEWEGRTYALNTAARAFLGNAHLRRLAIEKLPPAEYLRMSYYERWFARLVNILVESGRITAEEAATGQPDAASPKQTPPLRPDGVSAIFTQTTRNLMPGPEPRFREGQQVRTRKINPTGHTRLPRYARGRVGTIMRDHGVSSLPDALAELKPDRPQHSYSVRFSARELWGEQARPQDSVYLDLFEDYLEVA